MKSELKYPVLIRPLSEEDGGGYLAEFPDCSGAMSDGDTPEEALKNAMEALEGWLGVSKEYCDPIPEPVI